VLVPRLIAAGADCELVTFVGNVREAGKARSFDPAKDIEPLREAIDRAGGVDLLIVDPVVSAVAGDSHKNTEVRRALQPLVELASALDTAVLGITHFSKGTGGRDPVERLNGSLAFGALARVVMVAAKRQAAAGNSDDRRIFCRAKSNIGSDKGGFTYELHQREVDGAPGVFASSVRWLAPIEGTAREILAEAEAVENDTSGRKSEAEKFLQSMLTDSAMTVRELKTAAQANGISWRTIERAKRELGIIAVRSGFGAQGAWEWQFPQRPPKTAIKSEQENVATFGGLCNSDHLAVEI
jgi:putative DNA primase/helicase